MEPDAWAPALWVRELAALAKRDWSIRERADVVVLVRQLCRSGALQAGRDGELRGVRWYVTEPPYMVAIKTAIARDPKARRMRGALIVDDRSPWRALPS